MKNNSWVNNKINLRHDPSLDPKWLVCKLEGQLYNDGYLIVSINQAVCLCMNIVGCFYQIQPLDSLIEVKMVEREHQCKGKVTSKLTKRTNHSNSSRVETLVLK